MWKIVRYKLVASSAMLIAFGEHARGPCVSKTQRAWEEDAVFPLLICIYWVCVRMFRSPRHTIFWWAGMALATSLSLAHGKGPHHAWVLLYTEDFPTVKSYFWGNIWKSDMPPVQFSSNIYSSAIFWPGSLSLKTTWSQVLEWSVSKEQLSYLSVQFFNSS